MLLWNESIPFDSLKCGQVRQTFEHFGADYFFSGFFSFDEKCNPILGRAKAVYRLIQWLLLYFVYAKKIDEWVTECVRTFKF